MKFLVPAAMLLSLLVVSAPLLLFPPEEAAESEATAEVTVTPETTPTSAPDAAEATPGLDARTQVRLQRGEQVETLSMHDYLVGVVASEMPASFNTEALKAQAVAARTFTLYRMTVEPAHAGADVCGDINCCKAYADSEELRARWGGKYASAIASIEAAVSATDGLCLGYEGRAILAAFHSCSEGATEASENVWGRALPYLTSVSTPETEAAVPNLHTSVTFSLEELRALVADALPEAVLDPQTPELWFREASYSPSGRLLAVSLGGVTLTGTQLRTLLSLRSSAVTWSLEGEEMTFRVSGYGHGVGMSQYGANLLAGEGMNCGEILAHYYPGAVLQTLDVLEQEPTSV